MKVFYALATLVVLLVAYLIWPSQGSQKQFVAKPHTLALATVAPTEFDVQAEVPTSLPTSISTPEAKTALVEQPTHVPEVEKLISFAEANAVLMKHLQVGISQQELALWREQVEAANLPFRAMFAQLGVWLGSTSELNQRYQIPYMNTGDVPALFDSSVAMRLFGAYVEQLNSCVECEYHELRKQSQYNPLNQSQQIAASPDDEYKALFKAVNALARLNTSILPEHHLYAPIEFDANQLREDVEVLLASANEIFNEYGKFHQAIILADQQALLDIAKSSAADVAYVYALTSLVPTDPQLIFEALLARIENNKFAGDVSTLLEIALIYGSYYSLADAKVALDRLIARYPHLDNHLVAQTFDRGMAQGVQRLSELWQHQTKDQHIEVTGGVIVFEHDYDRVYHDRRGNKFTAQKLDLVFFTLFTGKKRGDAFLKAFERKFENPQDAYHYIEHQANWPRLMPHILRLDSAQQYVFSESWDAAVMALDATGTRHQLDAISLLPWELAAYVGEGAHAGVLHQAKSLAKQFTPFEQATLRLSNEAIFGNLLN